MTIVVFFIKCYKVHELYTVKNLSVKNSDISLLIILIILFQILITLLDSHIKFNIYIYVYLTLYICPTAVFKAGTLVHFGGYIFLFGGGGGEDSFWKDYG